MFKSSKYILYFSPQTIRAATVSGSGQSQKIERGKEIPWVRGTLVETLLGLKKEFGAVFSIILDDDLAFTFGIVIPADTKEERNFVRIKAAEEVPEELGDTGWDFKEILGSVDGKSKIVQFASVDGSFYKDLSKAARDSGIKIEVMEPMTCSLARLLAKRPEPVLVIHRTGSAKNLVFLSYRRLVFFVESFDAEPASKDILKYLEFVKGKFSFTPKAAFLSGTFNDLTSDDPAFAGCKVETGDLDPFSGMAMRQSAGEDDKVGVNILLDTAQPTREDRLKGKIVGISEIDKEPGAGEYAPIGLNDERDRRYPQGRLFTYIILGASLLVLLINGIILYQRDEVEKVIQGAAVVITPN